GAGAIARPAPKPSERPVRPVRPARPAEREVKEVEKAPESRDVRNKGEAQKVLLDGMDAANKGRALPRESNIEEVVVGGASKDPSMTGAYTIRSMLESIGGGKLTMAEC